MPTTVNTLPVPADTDPINQGALAIRNLAARLNPSAGGVVSLVFSNVFFKTAAITFPVGRFTAPPAVAVAVANTSVFYSYVAVAATATGCTIGAAHRDAALITVTVPANWIAVGVA